MEDPANVGSIERLAHGRGEDEPVFLPLVASGVPTLIFELLQEGFDAARRQSERRDSNPIEAHFGPLRQFTPANSRHRSRPTQTQALHRYLRWRNANARHPDLLAAQRKERARIHSEKGIRWGRRPVATAA
jgi:hypothetical protein